MNYIFRPTPVVTLGRDRGQDRVQLSRTPAGMLYGWPVETFNPSRSRGVQGDPWLVRSGSMASFGTLGNEPLRGLGDDGDDEMDFSTAFDSPTLPDDFSGAFSSPSIPAPDFGTTAAPDFGLPTVPSSGILTVSNDAPSIPVAIPGTQAAPASGAGATGRGIPGTQPLTAAASSTPSLAQAIANLFKPTAPAGSVVLPGVGINPNTAAPGASFLSASTIIPGTPNITVLLGGTAALLLVGVLLSGKRR